MRRLILRTVMDLDRNALGEETSPYLLQHKDNPVHWQAWRPDVLAAAKAANKPILLSVGYAACHWCHVMAHESFEDPATAAVMNELFVPIKVDREERPDVDTLYMHALAALGEQGGWPLTMFLTPEAEPFWGGTYFPPEPRFGRPAFRTLLAGVAQAFRDKPADVSKNVQALRDALQRQARPLSGDGIEIELLDRIADRLLREVDTVHGGVGGAPKFPQSGIFELLWRGWKRSGDTKFREPVLTTLEQMAQGGIYDHLGGGYARYSTDARWLAPHFEKMLYDNAELIALMTLVWQETQEPRLAQRIAETVDWLAREMIGPEGGFCASLDADSEHEEGKFYVWNEAEIDRLLGARAPLFKRHYDVTTGGNWESHNILNRLQSPKLQDEATEADLAACRAVLFHAREDRIHPGRDDKILADWNGLMIAALAKASSVFERHDWLDLATDAFTFVAASMTRPDGRLWHSWCGGRPSHPAILDDYANLCRAAVALFEATGDDSYVAQAEAWLAILDRHYWDPANHGYFLTADDTENLIARTKTANDAAVPAGNGTLLGVLARLYAITGETSYRDRADALLRVFAGEASRNFFPLATLLNNVELLSRPLQIVIRGDRDDHATIALRQAIERVSLPNAIISIVAPDAPLPANHPAAGKMMIDRRPTAYVCEGPVCSLPLTDPVALTDDLRQRH
jgi:uncharacterized protein YyaL (SSP411 family)